MSSPALPDDFDPDERELCPDGSCTGLLGDDGRCRVCGRAPEAPAAVAEGEAGVGAPAPEPVLVAGPQADGDDDDDTFTARTLCPDGCCVGVLGPDGRCPECGRRLEVQPGAP